MQASSSDELRKEDESQIEHTEDEQAELAEQVDSETHQYEQSSYSEDPQSRDLRAEDESQTEPTGHKPAELVEEAGTEVRQDEQSSYSEDLDSTHDILGAQGRPPWEKIESLVEEATKGLNRRATENADPDGAELVADEEAQPDEEQHGSPEVQAPTAIPAEEWTPDESFYTQIPPQITSSKDTSGLSAIEKQYAILPKSTRKRIYILGTGNIGKLVAHSLRSLPEPPPVTLLIHRHKIMGKWLDGSKEITVHRDGFDIHRTGIDAEVLQEEKFEHGQYVETFPTPEGLVEYVKHDPITNLIVSVKAPFTVRALRPIKHRLNKDSTICFLQNGLGIVEELNEKLFPDPDTRPTYIQGVNTHGVNTPHDVEIENPFYAVHAGQGTVSLGILPRERSKHESVAQAADKKFDYSNSARYLMRTLTRSPILTAVGFAPTDLFLLQLEKLAVNCIINCLTGLLDGRNGTLIHSFSLRRTMRLMLAEISLVIRSLPELRGLTNIETRFSAAHLETVVLHVAELTSNNISSMLADVRSGRVTEVDYINGYITKRGEQLGIKCVVNYAMMHLTKGKQAMVAKEVRSELSIGSYVPHSS